MDDIKVMPKPDWVSWDDIHELLMAAHKRNIEKGMTMKIKLNSPWKLVKIAFSVHTVPTQDPSVSNIDNKKSRNDASHRRNVCPVFLCRTQPSIGNVPWFFEHSFWSTDLVVRFDMAH